MIEEVGEPVPIAVTGAPRDLSPEAQQEIREPDAASPPADSCLTFWTWLLMLSAVGAAVYFQNIRSQVFVVLFVGIRQSVLQVSP